MFTLSLAFRNIFRHRFRSSIALLAIAFSTIVLMLAGGFVEWIFWAMRGAATESGLGHVQIMRRGFLENGSADPFSYLMPLESASLATIEADPQVKVVARRLNFSGLVSYGESTLSFVGTGVEADKEAIVSTVVPVLEGAGLVNEDPTGVLLGTGLAKNLGVPIGAKIVLLVNTASGGINAIDATVRGLFATQVKAYDDTALMIALPTAQTLLRVHGAHVWVVKLTDIDLSDQAATRFADRVADKGLSFVRWSDLADFYNKTVTLLSTQMSVVRLMIAVIIVLGMSNMLVMNVLERIGEIGTMMALGIRRRKVIGLFLAEGVSLGLVGGTIGVVVAWVLAHVISAIGIPMPPPPGRSEGYSAGIMLNATLGIGAFAVAVISTLLASLYPSWKASRLVIVDALRQNR